MKAFLISVAALVAIAVVAGVLLNTRFGVASSDRYVEPASVRLDEGQGSNLRYPD